MRKRALTADLGVHCTVTEQLAHSRMFRGLTAVDIAAIEGQATKRNYCAGTPLFRQGLHAKEIFFIVSGRVKQYQITAEGYELLLRFSSANEVAGYNALIADSKYAMSATAVVPTCALAWNGDVIRCLAQQYPQLALSAFEIAVGFLRDFEDRYCTMLTKPVHQRVARSLLQLADRIGLATEDGVVVTVLARDLAQLAATTTFSVSRILGDWERQRLLKKARGQITLFALDPLRSLGDPL